jgi:hypothetical protein
MFAKNSRFIAVSALMAIGLSASAQDTDSSPTPDAPKVKQVVIMPSDQGAATTQLATLVGSRLAHVRGIVLLDREKYADVIKVILDSDRPTNDSTRPIEKGKIKNVTTLIYLGVTSNQTSSQYTAAGKFFNVKTQATTNYTTNIAATVKVVDVETTLQKLDQPSSSWTAQNPNDSYNGAINNLATGIAKKLAEIAPKLTAIVDDVDAKAHEITVVLGARHRVRVGDVFEITSDEDKALQSGQVILVSTPICFAQVGKVGTDYCQCFVGTMERDWSGRLGFKRKDALLDKVQVKMTVTLK